MPPAQRLAAAGLLQRLWRGYEAQLAQRPVAVQMTTSAVLWAAGDALAQQLEGRSTVTLDARRLALTSLYGGAFVGPTGHYWYQGLDDLCTKWMRPGSVPFLATKVLLDTTVLGGFYIAGFFAFGCAVINEGKDAGLEAFNDKMRRDFIPTFLASLAFWPAAQTLNFARVPLRHQLLFVNTATILDAAFLSWVRVQEDWLETAKGALQRLMGKYYPSSSGSGGDALLSQTSSEDPDNKPAKPASSKKRS